jgi:hypothetical protein
MPFRPRVQLASGVGRDFERLLLPYLQFVFPGIAQPTPLATWDRRGVDLMTTPERSPIEVCVQCKSTVKKQFETSDIKEFTSDIDKFIASGIQCDRYIVALNRNDFNGLIQSALNDYVKGLPKKPPLEVWQLARIVDEAQDSVRNLILERVKKFNAEWRQQLIGRFAPSGSWVRRVPARTYRMMIDWNIEPELRDEVRSREVEIEKFLIDERGPHMGLLIGEDGTGKTSAALILSQAQDKTVIYVPAATLPTTGSHGTNVITRAIGHAIDVRSPDFETSPLFSYFLGRGLSRVLRQDPNVVLIIDGLDENRVYRGFQGLKLIRAQFKGMRCKTIISTRTKHFNLRTSDFSQALLNKGKVGRRTKGIRVVELRPWTKNTILKHIEDVRTGLAGQARNALDTLVDLVTQNKAEEIYGTLLSHPIFLDLIIDDVINDKVQQATRSSLVRSWILRKIKRDQDKYPGDPIGGDLISEARLIFSGLEDIALEMPEPQSRIPLESLRYTEIIRILSEYGITGDEMFEFLLKSVLVAVGQTTMFRDTNIMFSHRVFHEYMIASAMIRRRQVPSVDTPSEIAGFYEELKKI